MILKIYLICSIIATILNLMSCIVIAIELRREHPELSKAFSGKNKITIFEKIFSIIKNVLACFIPLFNLILIYVCLFKYEEVKEKSFNMMKTKLNKGENLSQ